MELSYVVRQIAPRAGTIALDDPLWTSAQELAISNFHPKSSDHHPKTRARLLHDQTNFYLRFDVDDRYVIAQSQNYQDMVCFDSCVEFFFRPAPGMGYFNLEINCGGTFLCYYIEDPRRTENGFVKSTPVSPEHASRITIDHSLPKTVFPERREATTWQIGCRIPIRFFEPYVGPLGEPKTWRADGNLYKCADHSSHPHWASWAPIGEALNFHDPRYFKPILFE